MKIKAILFGATGMVGEGVLHEALSHANVESVLVIGRKSCNVTHEKLKELLHADFYDYSAIAEHLRGFNACFFCLGVSSVGMKEEAYVRITYDLTLQAARTLSALNPDMAFCYVSGMGTDSSERGRSMWARLSETHSGKQGYRSTRKIRRRTIACDTTQLPMGARSGLRVDCQGVKAPSYVK
jgi:hypothetical protein